VPGSMMKLARQPCGNLRHSTVPSAVTTNAADGPIVGEGEGEADGEGEGEDEGDGDGWEPVHAATAITRLATVALSCSVILRITDRILIGATRSAREHPDLVPPACPIRSRRRSLLGLQRARAVGGSHDQRVAARRHRDVELPLDPRCVGQWN
jgi:hypothetical protein